MKFIAKSLACAAAAAALSAQAQGPYVGGSLGSSHYKGPDVGGLSTDRSATGGKLYGGYEFTPNIAVEAGVARLGEASNAAGSVRGEGLYVDAVGKVPITDTFSALGRVGAFNGRAKTHAGDGDRDTNLKVGLGLQYDFNEQTGIRGEWERYKFDAFGASAKSDMYSIGVNHEF